MQWGITTQSQLHPINKITCTDWNIYVQVSDSDDDDSDWEASGADTEDMLADWVHSFSREDKQKNAIIMTYHAMHTFHCTKMQAYQKTATAYHMSESTVRNL